MLSATKTEPIDYALKWQMVPQRPIGVIEYSHARYVGSSAPFSFFLSYALNTSGVGTFSVLPRSASVCNVSLVLLGSPARSLEPNNKEGWERQRHSKFQGQCRNVRNLTEGEQIAQILFSLTHVTI